MEEGSGVRPGQDRNRCSEWKIQPLLSVSTFVMPALAEYTTQVHFTSFLGSCRGLKCQCSQGCRHALCTAELGVLAVVEVVSLRLSWLWYLSLSYLYIGLGVLGLEPYHPSLCLCLHIAFSMLSDS